MRVALCDDEPKDLVCLETLCKKYDPNGQLECESFLSASQLLNAAETTSFDLILLDIEMEGVTGFEAAEQLIKQKRPPLIVFVTKSQAYCVRGYGVAFRYLVKPIQWQEFENALDAALMEYQSNRLMFNLNEQRQTVYIGDIMYLETYDHVTIVHTTQQQYPVRMSLTELAGHLPRSCFAFSQKSYLVNMHYIQTTTNAQITLTDGSKIPISRRKRTDFNAQLNDFLGR